MLNQLNSTVVTMNHFAWALLSLNILFLFPSNGLALDLRQSSGNPQGKLNISDKKNTQTSPAVQILSGGTSGSAVIIGKKGNTYVALTAEHVVKDYAILELSIKLQDGSLIDVESKESPFSGIDLSIIKFNTSKNIPVSILPFLDESLWGKVKDWPSIQVIGYSAPTPDAPSMLKEVFGRPESVFANAIDGYNFLYSAKTQVGLSGGGVFGTAGLVQPFFNDPEDPNGGFYYSNIAEDGPKSASNAGEVWNENLRLPSENIIYNRCMNNASYQPLFNEGAMSRAYWDAVSKRNRESACGFYAAMYTLENCKSGRDAMNMGQKDPNSYLLLAIHGRAERRDESSNNRTGSGLGIFLGASPIANYFKNNQEDLGLRKSFSFAKQVCEG